MKKTLPLLLSDFYKQVHSEQYNKDLNKLVSYYTPRMSRLKGDDKVICFGIQAFCKEYLIDYFNENFFDKTEEEVVTEYNRVLTYTLGAGTYKDDKIIALHRLGYLPIEIKAIPEGTRVPIKVPMIEISNTHPDFAWMTNMIESLISATLWHTMLSANVGFKYRQVVNYWYDKTVENSVPRNKALGDFSYRGQHSNESATKSSAAFCLSFLNTATVPAIPWLEQNYNCDCTKEPVAYGAISTEHSVMCSNYAIDGDERTFVKRLLTEIYPNNSFSMVSDSYDYWNMVTEILPSLKEEIMNHNGTLLVRGDSGDPVDIICGTKYVPDFNSIHEMTEYFETDFNDNLVYEEASYEYFGSVNGTTYRVVCYGDLVSSDGYEDDYSVYSVYDFYEITPEMKGTVELLWDTFGGTINSKGYKVLNPHIKAIYGDSITPQRAEEIYKRLEVKGFAANNVVLGVGSFSFMCLEEDGGFKPYTRDTYGVAVKATYGEINHKPLMIFKNPKTDTGHFKKSQKGICKVYADEKTNEITYKDGFTPYTLTNTPNLLQTVFKNGEMVKEYTLKEIRDRLHAETGGF